MGEKITDCESAISALQMRRHAAEQARDLAFVRLEAFKNELHKKPVDRDPRMKAVLREKRRIIRYIEKKKGELAELQKV